MILPAQFTEIPPEKPCFLANLGVDYTRAGYNTAMSEGAIADRLGIKSGDLIQEIGVDSDVDQALRQAIMAASGEDLLDASANEVVDAVLLWFRDGDGDLVDEMVDGLTFLSEAGALWLVTPKVGREGHVEPSDIQDAAPTAGLAQTSSFAVGADWIATKLTTRSGNSAQKGNRK